MGWMIMRIYDQVSATTVLQRGHGCNHRKKITCTIRLPGGAAVRCSAPVRRQCCSLHNKPQIPAPTKHASPMNVPHIAMSCVPTSLPHRTRRRWTTERATSVPMHVAMPIPIRIMDALPVISGVVMMLNAPNLATRRTDCHRDAPAGSPAALG